MKSKLIFSSFIALFVGLPFVRGQSITPDVINAAGGSGTIAGNTYEWSIGEIMVNTFTTSSVIVTEGVLQPNLSTAKIGETNRISGLSVFPNPTSAVVNIKLESSGTGVLTSRLVDITGKTLVESKQEITQGTTTHQIDVKQFACATYMLQVFYKTNNGIEESATFKILKLN